MLDIINNLAPFFEDNYERINIRRYSRLMRISPPTASKLLKNYAKENLLEISRYERYIFFNAKRDDKDFIDLSRMYWRYKLGALSSFFASKFTIEPTLVLFGSLSKAEVKIDSDIDLAIIGVNSESSLLKDMNFATFEKKLGRRIDVFRFKSLADARKLPIWKALLNGYVLRGSL